MSIESLQENLEVLDLIVVTLLQDLDKLEVINIMDMADNLEDSLTIIPTGDPVTLNRLQTRIKVVVHRLHVLAGS